MAGVEVSSTPAFTRLPVEILEQILEYNLPDKSQYSYWRDILDVGDLKSLRLASRQYAYLPKLAADLFHRVQLTASPEHAELAHVTDLSAVKQYVKMIVMKPTKYSWTMTEQNFEDIVLITPLQEFCDEKNNKIRARSAAGEDVSSTAYLGDGQFAQMGMRGFVRAYMNGEMPFSEQEIGSGFERYMQHANRTREAFEAKQIERAWAKVLVQLPDVHLFKIGKWDYTNSPKQPWKELGCNIYGHAHNYRSHEEDVCRKFQEPVGEALFSAAIASLTAARSKITSLAIKSIVDDRFTWATDNSLTALPLSHLETLCFEPRGPEVHPPETIGPTTTRYNLATLTLLSSCAQTLTTLTFCASLPSTPMCFPPASLPPFPRLTTFKTALTLRLSAFSSFLASAPALTHLELDSCHGTEGGWRELWDAIREHPSRMQLQLSELPCLDWTELSVWHHTGEESRPEYEEGGDEYELGMWSLEMYLSGRGRWRRVLGEWFEGGWDSDEDEGWDEDGDEEGDSDEVMDEDEV